jgi:hypothetical protein
MLMAKFTIIYRLLFLYRNISKYPIVNFKKITKEKKQIETT